MEHSIRFYGLTCNGPSTSLRTKRFFGLGTKNEEQESKAARKMAQVKEPGGGRGRKEANACSQTPGF